MLRKNFDTEHFLIGFITIGIVGAGLLTGYAAFQNYFTRQQSRIPPHNVQDVFKRPPGITVAPEATVSAKIRIPIIMFHYVEPLQDPNDTARRKLTINPYVFERQLQTFQQAGYELYFVRDIPQILDGKQKAASRSAVLSFDDGYGDFYTTVLPLLKKYQMKATLYIIYDFIGRKGFLTQNQIKEVIQSGLVEIGAHTMDHVYLKRANPVVARHQIIDSKKLLEELFSIKIETFAYPYGAFDQNAIDLVKEASFSAAVSVIPGTIQSKENIFFLYRLRTGVIAGQNLEKILQNYPK